ncbi:MAG: hypothetical protein Q7U77_00955 [Sediminibacterium sp.]|nr:hypothetical protein [Sediminibacterium sp.]MDO8995175.1 hypothetical protein [Sediminibacterium sp.]
MSAIVVLGSNIDSSGKTMVTSNASKKMNIIDATKMPINIFGNKWCLEKNKNIRYISTTTIMELNVISPINIAPKYGIYASDPTVVKASHLPSSKIDL